MVTARLNNLRMAPRKVRLIANMVKGMPVEDAAAQLQFMTKHAARPLRKLLLAVAADAEHNYQLVKEDLIIRSMIVEAAPTFKRYMPRAFGRAGLIRKRGSNVIVTVESRTGAKIAKKVVAKKEEHDHEHEEVKDKVAPTTGAKRSTKTADTAKPKTEKRKPRLFSRKTGSS